jgi:hypothetical protein
VSQISLFPTAEGTHGSSYPVYNFAVARVTLQGLTVPAENVQVFFRLFPAPSSGTYFTSYEAGSAYANEPATNPSLRLPIVGTADGQILTVPFFAAARSRVTTAAPDLANWQASISPASSGEPVYKYFGCWLDINQPGVSITYQNASGSQSSVVLGSVAASEHQCLVAEIYYGPLPIPSGAVPGISTNQIAQRNLAVAGGSS